MAAEQITTTLAALKTPIRGVFKCSFVSHSSAGQKLGGCDRAVCVGSFKVRVQVSAGLGSDLEVLEEDLFPGSFRFLEEFTSAQL